METEKKALLRQSKRDMLTNRKEVTISPVDDDDYEISIRENRGCLKAITSNKVMISDYLFGATDKIRTEAYNEIYFTILDTHYEF